MDKIINERFIKLSSRLPFPKDIQLGDDLLLIIKGRDYIDESYVVNCVKSEDEDNQDGTFNRVYKLKHLGE